MKIIQLVDNFGIDNLKIVEQLQLTRNINNPDSMAIASDGSLIVC